eukprot:3679345-Rhodomonas_salina.1
MLSLNPLVTAICPAPAPAPTQRGIKWKAPHAPYSLYWNVADCSLTSPCKALRACNVRCAKKKHKKNITFWCSLYCGAGCLHLISQLASTGVRSVDSTGQQPFRTSRLPLENEETLARCHVPDPHRFVPAPCPLRQYRASGSRCVASTGHRVGGA